MCFISLIGKEQLPCCISTIFLSSTALAGEIALCVVKMWCLYAVSSSEEAKSSVRLNRMLTCRKGGALTVKCSKAQ